MDAFEMTTSVLSPRFTITPSISDNLKRIEMARILLETVILPLEGYGVLRDRSHVRASYACSLIGGGHLTLEQAAALIADETIEIKGLENDVVVVRNYWKALQKAEEWAKMSLPLTETLICRFHRLAMTGKSSHPTPAQKEERPEKLAYRGCCLSSVPARGPA